VGTRLALVHTFDDDQGALAMQNPSGELASALDASDAVHSPPPEMETARGCPSNDKAIIDALKRIAGDKDVCLALLDQMRLASSGSPPSSAASCQH
jgi:hypothetical protein